METIPVSEITMHINICSLHNQVISVITAAFEIDVFSVGLVCTADDLVSAVVVLPPSSPQVFKFYFPIFFFKYCNILPDVDWDFLYSINSSS